MYAVKPLFPQLYLNRKLTSGLVFDVPFFEGAGTSPLELVNRMTPSAVGSPTWTDTTLGKSFKSIAANLNYYLYSACPTQMQGIINPTMELIAFPTDITTSRNVFIKGTTSTRHHYFGIRTDNTSTNAWCWMLDYSGNNPGWGSPNPTLVLNAINHVFVTHSNIASTSTTPTFYINGRKYTTYSFAVAPTGTINADDAKVVIGADDSPAPTSANTFAGNIILGRIWNRNLSDQDIAELTYDPWCIYTPPLRQWLKSNSIRRLPALGVG